MREIKFRAWNRERKFMGLPFRIEALGNGGMLYGDLELMQYIGLKDKNGKEIYEGDIVKGESFGTLYEVKYEQEYAGFYPFINCDYGATSYFDNVLEIIGNIYENPELLNKE